MKRAKPIFVTSFMMLMNIAMIFSLVNLFQSKEYGIWLSAILTTLPPVVFFSIIFVVDIPRTGKFFWALWIPILLGFSGLLFFSTQAEEINTIALLIGTFALASWGLYIFWYSRFRDRDTGIIKVGEILPDFSLQNLEGNMVPTTELIDKPTVFLFYRGNWCPFCVAQIKEIAGQYQEIENRGAQLIFVSPQPNSHNQKLANKLNIPAHFMTDKDHAAARKLGIIHEKGTPLGLGFQGYDEHTVMPTVLVTDGRGVLAFADLTDNYRVRPEPKTYLQALDRMPSSRTF